MTVSLSVTVVVVTVEVVAVEVAVYVVAEAVEVDVVEVIMVEVTTGGVVVKVTVTVLVWVHEVVHVDDFVVGLRACLDTMSV